ncbi:MAG: DinB family protein [Mucilaginibacter polytrichastri]|nr:DinB family protein [Mucilaginibacter polytrichastri]
MQSIDLKKELQKAFEGEPWHGPALVSVLKEVNPAIVNQKQGQSHSIAELASHLTAWAEECAERIGGKAPSLPARGDWPEDISLDEAGWEKLVSELKVAQQNLLDKISTLANSDWQTWIGSGDEIDPEAGYTIQEMILGTIQHYAYHGGQIILLARLFN